MSGLSGGNETLNDLKLSVLAVSLGDVKHRFNILRQWPIHVHIVRQRESPIAHFVQAP
jgi:hypothetical protein